MKKVLSFLFLAVTLMFSFPAVNMSAQSATNERYENEVEIDTDIETYINENSEKVKSSKTSSVALEALNSVVKDSKGTTHYLSANTDTGDLSVIDTYSDTKAQPTSRSSKEKIYTKFYVGGDYVGKIHFTATRTKHNTGSSGTCGIIYYEWSNISNFSYDKRENSFVVKDFSAKAHNTSSPGSKSYIKETVKWDTNKSSTTTQSGSYYAPKNVYEK